MALAPEQFASLKKVLSEPAAKASVAVGIPTAQVELFLGRLEKLVQRGQFVMGQEKILAVFKPKKTGGQALSDALVTACLADKKCILTLGSDLTLIDAKKGQISLVAAADKSLKEGSLCVICGAGQLQIFMAGIIIGELNEAPSPIIGRPDWRRSSRELRKSLDEHFEHCIESEKAFRYWANKKKRELLAGPDGTEKLFHHSLFWWCNNVITDAVAVHGEANGMGQDKTDITIVTQVGALVLEVKWMGRNENKTEYPQRRIEEGLRQVALYLKNNPRLIQGFVVLYDGRSAELNRTKSSYPKKCMHPKCEDPVIYFLRSETPSEQSEREAREAAAKGK